MSVVRGQTTWYVDKYADPNGNGMSWGTAFDTIADGIDAASDGDTVQVADGDYTGPGNRDLVISDPNAAITVKSQNGPDNCIIDCDGGGSNYHRAFSITNSSGEVTHLEGFTIINGYIYNDHGGAIWCTGYWVGGEEPVWTSGALSVTDCVFENNKCTLGGLGGAIALASLSGGAIIDCTFIDNESAGGAVAFNNVDQHTNHFDIINCQFIGNRSTAFCGALGADQYLEATITNCRFAGNWAPYGGGAMSCANDCELTFINCTMSGNRANSNAGAINITDDSEVVLENCILWGDDQHNELSGPEISLHSRSSVIVTYSDIAGGEEDITLAGDSTVTWGDGNIESDALFDSPGYWTDPHHTPDSWSDDVWNDGTYRLSVDTSTSPCIDAGDYEADLEDPDLDGNDRVQRCEVDMGAYEYVGCGADLNLDGVTDLSDLATLLGNYGMTTGATYADGDVAEVGGVADCDRDVDLDDLAALLGHYGCGSSAKSKDGGGGGGRGTYVDLSVAAVDTNGYSGGGFSGEVDHFVFDLQIEVDDPNNDDWLVSGAALDASNDAEFRLSAAAYTPNQYATFVAAPWTSLPASDTANVAGGYDPADPNATFEVDEINIGWYDTATDSHDGPATVMRIVIDVSDVADADVSSGFGSVYFAKAKKNAGDILLAELDAGACTADAEGAMDTYYGSFFVAGE